MSEQPDLPPLARDAVDAADSKPLDVGLRLRAAEMLLHAGNIAQAVEAARVAVELDPTSARAARTLSGMLNLAGDSDAAIRFGDEAVRLEPENAEARLHLGGLLAGRRRWQQAAVHLAAHVGSSAVTARGWRLLAGVLFQAGQSVRATEAARNAVMAAPHEAEYRLHLVSLLCARGLWTEAQGQIVAALELHPNNPLMWRAQSGILAALGQIGPALQGAERAVALAPGNADMQRHLAHVAQLCQVPVASDPAQWRIEPRRIYQPRARVAPATFWQDLATRWRVIHAIIRRDIRTRFGHTRLGYFWAIMEPIGHLLTLGSVFWALNHAPPPLGDNMFLFYITGLVPFLMFSHVSHDVMGTAEGSNAVLQLPIVRRTDLIAAHALRQLATELVVGLIIFAVAGLLGVQGLPADPLTAAIALILLWLLAVGLGTINVVLSELFPSYETFYAALIRLLYFSSGIYYSPIMMPDMVRDWLLWNPVLHGIDLFRSGFFSQYEPHWLNVSYLLTWVVGSIGIGLSAERALRFRMPVRV